MTEIHHAETLDTIPAYQAPLTAWQWRKRWLREELGTFVGVGVILVVLAAVIMTGGGYWPSFGHAVAKVLPVSQQHSVTKVAAPSQRAVTVRPPGTTRPFVAVVSPRVSRSPAPSATSSAPARPTLKPTPAPTVVRPTPTTASPPPPTPTPTPTPTTPSPVPTTPAPTVTSLPPSTPAPTGSAS